MKNDETKKTAKNRAFEGLLYQLLETELGGVQVYRAAIRCAINPGLKKEWEKYLRETERHVQIARALVEMAGLDPLIDAPARLPIRCICQALVTAITEALENRTPAEAELTAAECVVEAEAKDRLNWEIVGLVATQTKGEMGAALAEAYDEIEQEEDRHFHHATGWARELWIQALGMPAVLPPPEEEKKVQAAIGAGRTKSARQEAAHAR